MLKNIEGFSKLTKKEKIDWVVKNHFKEPEKAKEIILSYNHQKEDIQKVHDEFIENSLSNFFLPFGVAPNFLINNKLYTIPMAIEDKKNKVYGFQFHPESFLTENGKTIIKKILST